MRRVALDGRRRRIHRLSEELATENTAKPIGFVGRLKPVVAHGLQLKSLLESVEGTEHRRLE